MVARLTRYQHDAEIFGTVGEIGVHHGKFTAAISGFASEDEVTVAVDLFSHQEQNVDGSGQGDLDHFRNNLEVLSLWDGIFTHETNSMSLTAHDLLQYDAFRLLSVDGGHTHDTTLNDLLFACEVMAEGGVVIVDDFVNIDWLGVAAGVFDFVRSQEILVPFLWLANKLYLTTADHHKKYVSFLHSLHPELCDNPASAYANGRKIFSEDYVVCIVRCDDRLASFCEHMSNFTTIKGLLPTF